MKTKLKFSAKEYAIRMAVIFFAALAPYICLFSYGYLNSLSQYWNTELQPVFVFANALTSYYLYTMDNWKWSALCLLLLTAFSVEMYPDLHNFLAVAFFIITIVPLWKANHFKWTFWVYLSSLIVLPWSMLFAEIIAINALCLYHGLLLRKAQRLTRDFSD